ncbi:hypothetical protein AN218_18470 [Streptomyces nanshensis]|uniref:Peptidase C14 caspase domain-containing protein n=1 Tax=Streptomyces nanshensis TaxID=518642 RepID=A0A1E7L2J3_9ACTN|nr:hypothetical protein AN218_18470 [Streptomyces nanshensis]
MLIWSGAFADPAYRELPAAERTVRRLEKQLLDPAVWGLEVTGCRVLGPDYDREQILGAVRAMSRQAEECFVLYFAGHGVDHDRRRLLLPLAHSSAGLPGSMLAFADLTEAMDAGRAERKIVLLDCCHAGRGLGSLPFEQQVAGQPPEGCYVLAASAAQRPATSPEDSEFTAFGEALLSCLATGGAPDEPFWSPEGLLAAMDGRLTGEGNSRPVTNRSPVGERPWLKNRNHRTPYAPAVLRRDAHAAARTGGAAAPAEGAVVRYLGPDPVPPPQPFVGREAMLSDVRRRVGVGQVLPVVGNHHVGKSALLSSLVTDAESLSGLPLPPVVLEIEPSAAAESPLLEALARALHQTLDDSERPAASERRGEELLDWILPRYVKGSSLVLVVKGSHLDLARPELQRELDELLAREVFERAAVVVETTDAVAVDGHGRLEPRPPLVVTPLETRDALRLIGERLGAESLSTDLDALLSWVEYDDIVRRPGVIVRAVLHASRLHRKDDWDSFLAAGEPGTSSGPGSGTGPGPRAEGVVAQDEFERAIVEAAAPTIALALDRALPPPPQEPAPGAAPYGPDGRATLMVWGVLDRLPLAVSTLRRLGLPDEVLRVLFNEGVLVPHRPSADAELRAATVGAGPHLEISLVSREALRTFLRETVRVNASSRALGSRGAAYSADLDERLTAAARRLVSAVLPGGRADEDGDEGTPALTTVIEVLRRAAGWLDLRLPEALPRLRERLGYYVNSDYPDASLLPVAQTLGPAAPALAPAVPDTVPEADPDGDPEGAGVQASVDGLYVAAGRLNIASRAPTSDENAAGVFLAAFEEAVSLLAATGDVAPAAMLRSVDQSALHGARRLRVTARTVPARGRLLRRLAAGDGGQGGQGGQEGPVPGPVRVDRLIASVSWALNTGSAQLHGDDRDGARASLRTAERLLEALPPAHEARARQTRKWLGYRVARLRHRVAESSGERHDATREAYGLARENLLAAHDLPARELPGREQEWTKHLLTSGHQYARETREDEERLTLAEQTLHALESAWGPRAEWPVPLAVRTAAFLRQVHRRHADLARQYRGAREVLAFLHALTGGDPDAAAGSRPALTAELLVELANSYELLASVQRDRNEYALARQSLGRALRTAHRAAETEPGVRSYMAWLRLLRTKQSWSGNRGGEVLPELKDAVQRIREWLDQQEESGDPGPALLHLWCLQCDWMREGGLLIAADNLPLPGTSRQLRLDRVFRRRMGALRAHERVYGPTWPSYKTRIRMVREHRRCSAIEDRTPLDVDHGPVWEALDEAGRLFPHDLDVVRERALYHRYIWEYDKAAALRVEAARQELNGDKARRDLVAAAECLLSRALYQKGLSEEERTAALRSAAEHLRGLSGLHLQSHHAALLSARISLELDEADWTEADAKFVELIDEDFVSTVAHYLNERSHRTAGDAGETGDGETEGLTEKSTEAPSEKSAEKSAEKSMALQDLLEEHFTEREVLVPLGQLYLRRAVLGVAEDRDAALTSAWRAYNCFDGCRVMEEAVSGHERVTTAFLRAQTITWAAELTSSADPFPADSGRHRNLLRLAGSRLQSARDRSVGLFHELITDWELRLRALSSALDEQ